jgi:hypothetical protein
MPGYQPGVDIGNRRPGPPHRVSVPLYHREHPKRLTIGFRLCAPDCRVCAVVAFRKKVQKCNCRRKARAFKCQMPLQLVMQGPSGPDSSRLREFYQVRGDSP